MIGNKHHTIRVNTTRIKSIAIHPHLRRLVQIRATRNLPGDLRKSGRSVVRTIRVVLMMKNIAAPGSRSMILA